MKLELFSEATNKLWKKMSGSLSTTGFSTEMELYKKLLNFFQVGDFYYYIFNFSTCEFDMMSTEVEKILGYPISEINALFLMDHIHPEDRPWFLAFETQAADFFSALPMEKMMKYKMQYDFRVKNKSGKYIRILHQVAIIEHDENGGIFRTLGVHTNITHLKQSGKPVLSYIGMDGEPSYVDVNIKNTASEVKEVLTKREKLILALLIEGKLSKEIGTILNISKQTVDTHRKNMLFKSKLNSTGELIGKAIRYGWV